MAGRSHADRLRLLHGLYAIVGDDDPIGAAHAAVAGGASVVQVRMKRSPASAILEATRQIVAGVGGQVLVIVNDRADLAILSGADGLHVGDQDLPVEEARRLLGPDPLLGRTCRTLADARRAAAEGADHVGLGPIFSSRSKALAVEPIGIEPLRQTSVGCGVPVVAIGGISSETIAEVAGAGAACAAVIEDLFRRGDVRSRAAVLANRFEEGAKALR